MVRIKIVNTINNVHKNILPVNTNQVHNGSYLKYYGVSITTNNLNRTEKKKNMVLFLYLVIAVK